MSHFAETFPRRVMEWVSASCIASFGLLLCAGVATGFLDPIPAGERYLEGLVRIAPLSAWGPWLLIIGMWRLVALTINGAWRPTPHMRALTAGLSGMVYLQLLIGVVAASGPLFLLAMAPPAVGAEIYVAMRAAAEARDADERARRERRGPRNGASH